MRADDQTTAEVVSVFDAFCQRFWERDIDGALAVFVQHPDLAVIGSEAGQEWTGIETMRGAWSALQAGPRRYGWRWTRRRVWCSGDVAWFAADGDEVVEEASGERTIPYTMSGTAVRRDGRWLLAFLHGSEPA